MKTTFKVKYIIGLLAIVVGAVASFDSTFVPELRYLAIYLSILVIALIAIDSIYVDTESETYQSIREDQ